MAPSDSKTYQLLLLEGELFRGCLKAGLNALVDAHVGSKGAYYTAFFQLSIGLERLFKVALILDHMARNRLTPPSVQTVKSYGHDLRQLLSAVCALPSQGTTPLSLTADGSMTLRLVNMLSTFAKTTRYHNLDGITGGSTSNDPLAEWHGIAATIFNTEISEKSKKAALTQPAMMAMLMDHSGSFSFVGYTLTGDPLDTYAGVMGPAMDSLANRYAARHIITLLQHTREVLSETFFRCHEARRPDGSRNKDVPFMYEFLDDFLMSRKDMLRRKRFR